MITITGSNFDDLASGLQAGNNVSSYLDWDQFTWDINNDGSDTADVRFDASTDLTSAVYTSATQLTVTLNSTGETKLEGAGDFAALGGTDRVDVAAGFTSDSAGNASATDSVTAAAITYVNADGAPTLDSFTVQNANGDAISSTTVGLAQELTIVAQMSEEILATSTNVVTIGAVEVPMSVDANDPTTMTGTYTVPSNLTTSALSVESFTIGSVADIYGTAMTSTTVPTGSDALSNSAIAVDTAPPETTISGITYNPGSNVITITGSNFDDLASGLQAGNNVSSYLDWDQFMGHQQ